MDKKFNIPLMIVMIAAVAVLSSAVTRLWIKVAEPRQAAAAPSKLAQAQEVIDRYYVGDYDPDRMEDESVAAMVQSLGDRWSYYLPASEVEAYRQTISNQFAGIGVIIEKRESGTTVVSIFPKSPAASAGLPLDCVILRVNGESAEGLEVTEVKDLVTRHIAEGLVRLTVLTDGEEREYEIVPATFEIDPVSFELLEEGVGLIRVDNFDSRSGRQIINACRTLQEQGATALIFDLRFNPGGQLEELLQALDYLLPEGVIFLSQEKGEEMVAEKSDAACLRLPMAVLVNRESYSAAEFFAAALQEYEWAVVVGEQTTGKGYAQITVSLSDGSAMHISARKYYTPKGVSLAGVGLTPNVEAELSDEDFMMLYYDRLAPADDEQLQAAIKSVKSEG